MIGHVHRGVARDALQFGDRLRKRGRIDRRALDQSAMADRGTLAGSLAVHQRDIPASPARKTAERFDASSVFGPGLEMAVLPAPHRATLWPVRPKLLPGELLSSWLWRTARASGAPPRRFVRDAVGAELADLDRDIDDDTLARLAFLSGGKRWKTCWRGLCAPTSCVSPTIRSPGSTARCLRHGDLVLNCTHQGRSAPIIQYCPVCLGRDAAAHLRRGWRFSIAVVCFIDGCFLLDACWRCGALLDPLAGGRPSADFRCVRCGARLSAAPALQMAETVRDQQMLFAALLCLLFPAEPDRSMMSAQAYIDERSAGALRGTNPANPADRHHAVLVEAWRIRDAALRQQPRSKSRPRAATGVVARTSR